MTDSVTAGRSATPVIWRIPLLAWVLLALTAAGLVWALYPHGLNRMFNNWMTREEYSHSIILPFLSAFFVWQKKDLLEQIPFQGSWAGFFVVFAGALSVALGHLSAITIFVQYGFYVILAGLAWAYVGWRGFREIWVAFLLLMFTIPLPGLIYQGISQQLQLISTYLGVAVIQALDISVYSEGNVIDLGVYKLQVVEACDGLRYLFPLSTLGLIMAYFFKVEAWKRVLVLFSSVPITVMMNSFRIGVIGITVEYWGVSMAEGFLHDFEGWVVFMACTGLMLLEMWLLVRFSKDTRPFQEVFGLEFPADAPADAEVRTRDLPKALIASIALAAVVAVGASVESERDDVQLARSEFINFPDRLGDWRGRQTAMDDVLIERLAMDDYLMSDYRSADKKSLVNLYVAYYGSQSKGASIHSPAACIPGGGWQISDIKTHPVDGITIDGVPLVVNRVEIQKGDDKQLVWYWFQQRGRVITDEYLLKWYLFIDGLQMNRTDGALIRLTSFLQPGESWEDAEARLHDFAALAVPELEDYIPD